MVSREKVTYLKECAKQLRKTALTMIYTAQSGHPGGSFSVADIIAALYFDELNIDPQNPQWAERDRFVLSKGHVCPIQYAALIQRGFMEKSEIDLNATGYEILNDTNKTKDNILKGALIVGGNATGKSTVLKAIEFLLELLVWQVNMVPVSYLCLFKDATNKMKLEYEFLINKEKINYEIECNEKGIYKERLLVSGKEKINRIGENGIYIRSDQQEIAIEKLQFNQSAVRKVYFDTKFIDNATLLEWFEFLEQSVYIDQFGRNI